MRESNMNYAEIIRVYNNEKNDELLSQTGYEFKLFDDYYYRLFHYYPVTNSEEDLWC